ncbi:MAG: RNase P subunit p30 family protein [Candidatus Woesearchaeota archaeon]
MFVDIALPRNNEEDFLSILEKLNTRAVCFAYSKEDFVKTDLNKIKNKNIKIYKALYLEGQNINKAKELRQKLKPDLIITNDSSRITFTKNIDIVFELENQEKDFFRYVNSGFDSVKASLAVKHNIMLGISSSLILNTNNSRVSRILSRMQQNFMLCRKKKVKLVIASFARKPLELRAYHELFSLGFTLKADSKQLKESLKKNLYERLCFNQKLNQGKILEEGVEVLTDEEINEILKKARK